MSKKYFIVAGPQAAGKSALIYHISSEYPKTIAFLSRSRKGIYTPSNSKINPLQESRQIIVHTYHRKGAIFMSDLDELEVIHNDMTRMFKLLRREDEDETYIDECNVFTLSHAKAHGIDLLDGYYKQYCDMLKRFRTGIIFLDIPPDVSWERRKFKYEQRLWDMDPAERENTMNMYREYLDKLYPELLKMYDMLDFLKIKVDSSVSLEEALTNGENAFETLLMELM